MATKASFLVVAGITPAMARLFGERADSKLGQEKWRIIWKPMPRRALGYTGKYVGDVYYRFAEEIRKSAKAGGELRCALGYVSYGSTDATLLNAFRHETLAFPFADTNAVAFDQKPPARVSESVNKAIHELRVQLANASRSLNAIEKEVRSRINRTPVMLPLRAFGYDEIDDLLKGVGTNVLAAGDPFSAVKKEVEGFCRRHPRRSFSHDPKKHFVNPKGVVFRTPAGRPHGTLDPDFHGDHGVQCFPRSRLRLGSSFDPAFHYDCCASGRGALPASWIGCHGQIIAIKGTRRHANVYPNDYVR